jgi:hypothetical protein
LRLAKVRVDHRKRGRRLIARHVGQGLRIDSPDDLLQQLTNMIGRRYTLLTHPKLGAQGSQGVAPRRCVAAINDSKLTGAPLAIMHKALRRMPRRTPIEA